MTFFETYLLALKWIVASIAAGVTAIAIVLLVMGTVSWCLKRILGFVANKKEAAIREGTNEPAPWYKRLFGID